jgi:hypothetical protein
MITWLYRLYPRWSCSLGFFSESEKIRSFAHIQEMEAKHDDFPFRYSQSFDYYALV